MLNIDFFLIFLIIIIFILLYNLQYQNNYSNIIYENFNECKINKCIDNTFIYGNKCYDLNLLKTAIISYTETFYIKFTTKIIIINTNIVDENNIDVQLGWYNTNSGSTKIIGYYNCRYTFNIINNIITITKMGAVGSGVSITTPIPKIECSDVTFFYDNTCYDLNSLKAEIIAYTETFYIKFTTKIIIINTNIVDENNIDVQLGWYNTDSGSTKIKGYYNCRYTFNIKNNIITITKMGAVGSGVSITTPFPKLET